MRNLNKKAVVFIFAPWALVLGVFLSGLSAHAQKKTNTKWSPPAVLARVAVKGTVENVLQRDCSMHLLTSRVNEVHVSRCADLLVSTKDGLVNLLLGPTSFIRHNYFFFVSGDQVIAIGFRTSGNRRAAVVAEEVVKSKRALALRDSKGHPLWNEYEKHGTGRKHGVSQAAGQSSTKPMTSTFYHPSSNKIPISPEHSESHKET